MLPFSAQQSVPVTSYTKLACMAKVSNMSLDNLFLLVIGKHWTYMTSPQRAHIQSQKVSFVYILIEQPDEDCRWKYLDIVFYPFKSSKKSSLKGQFSLTNIRLINLRTCKGTTKCLRLQQHRQSMLRKNLWYKYKITQIINVCVLMSHQHIHTHTPILILLNQVHSAIDWTHTHLHLHTHEDNLHLQFGF